MEFNSWRAVAAFCRDEPNRSLLRRWRRGRVAILRSSAANAAMPLTKGSFGNSFKAACVAAGILDKSAHGLRKLSATIRVERGVTEHELIAMFG